MSKRANTNQQNTTQKMKDRPTQTTLKTGCELSCSRMGSSSCSTCGNHLVSNPVMISHEWWKELDCDYDKPNISMVICDTDTL